jgi:hypothetical protein
MFYFWNGVTTSKLLQKILSIQKHEIFAQGQEPSPSPSDANIWLTRTILETYKTRVPFLTYFTYFEKNKSMHKASSMV